MAIEGPLRELGLHDVFQLLDLSRKTGVLRITSELRDNEGKVYFNAGHVVFASVRSNPHAIGTMLVRSGRITEDEFHRARARQVESAGAQRLGAIMVDLGFITPRELERQLRLQVEAVVYELLAWREGTFSFSEQRAEELDCEATVRLSTESLLMEAARRMDEWSVIGDYIPSLDAIPTLATTETGGGAPVALRPDEWELLSVVDGERDLRAVAAALGASEFDVAKLVAHLVKAGILAIQERPRMLRDSAAAAAAHVQRACAELRHGALEDALDEARLAIAADPGAAPARLVAARVLLRLGRAQDALEELRRAAQFAPDEVETQAELGFAAVRLGHLAEGTAAWRRCLDARPPGELAADVLDALDAAERLRDVLERRAGAADEALAHV